MTTPPYQVLKKNTVRFFCTALEPDAVSVSTIRGAEYKFIGNIVNSTRRMARVHKFKIVDKSNLLKILVIEKQVKYLYIWASRRHIC